MYKSVLCYFFLGFVVHLSAQSSSYVPVIEPGPCKIKIGPGLVSQCGNLVVPENRAILHGRKIKIPFVYITKPGRQTDKTVILFTTGGPGYSTLSNFDSIGPGSELLEQYGFIAFDQRGVKGAEPCLDCPEINKAWAKAYTENLPKEKALNAAVIACRNRLTASGIDLSAYTTIASAEDINDLRKTLKLDSLILQGISYSGGLMLTVARNHPEGVKALLLRSPLPGFVNYEEHGLININDALNAVFEAYEKDSLMNNKFGNLRLRFYEYFSGLNGKKFFLNYLDEGQKDSIQIQYDKNELLDAVVNKMNNAELRAVPEVINGIILGKHEQYVKSEISNAIHGNKGLAYGMRLSIYCSEQIAFSDPKIIKEQNIILPWLADFRFNNVDHTICSCWNVKPEPTIAKSPIYSNIPALIIAGDMDPWCPPYYNKIIQRGMPNSQSIIVHFQSHIPRMGQDGSKIFKSFLSNPYKKITSLDKNLKIE